MLAWFSFFVSRDKFDQCIFLTSSKKNIWPANIFSTGKKVLNLPKNFLPANKILHRQEE